MADQMTGLLSPFLRRRRLAAVGPFVKTGKVLDFGCGVGELVRDVAPERYLGVDLDAESIKAARELHPGHAFQTLQEFESSPPSREFDVISALALIEHLPDPGAWLASMAVRLKPEGLLVITTPHPSMRWVHDFGAKLGIFSREAADEHEDMLDRSALLSLAKVSGLGLSEYRRFLFGCNQLAVFRLETESPGFQNAEPASLDASGEGYSRVKPDVGAAFRFALLSATSFLVIFFLTIFLHESLRVREEWAFAIVLFLTMVMNFLMLRYFVYPGKHSHFFRQLGVFIVSSLSFRGLEYVLFLMFHSWLGLPYRVVIVGTLVTTFMVKFFYFGSVVFSRRIVEPEPV